MEREPGFVVVGVDESAAAETALAFALDEGVAHGCAVEVVTAWLFTSAYEGMNHVTSIPEGATAARAHQDQVLRRALDGRTARPPVSQVVVHAEAGRALVERAEGARLLVVGSARKGPLARTVLGSTSEFCVRHAPAPVTVVATPARLHHRAPGVVVPAEVRAATG